MPGAAAIFDLDRTVLCGSSTPAFNEALFEVGLSPRRGVLAQSLMMRAYDLVGETAPSMALARLAACSFAGKPVDGVREAARLAAGALQREVAPWVIPLLDSHRRAGRRLVLATTSPSDLVQPIADRLGFDQLIATRYKTRDDEAGSRVYTGSIEGGFVWSLGKLAAVRRWAEAEKVALGQCWAYSDSVYDLPLLAAVGHPTAVNPDLRLLAAATVARWPVVHLDAPPGVPKLLGTEAQDVLQALLVPRLAFPYARFDIAGVEHIPRRGPVIVAANHRSYFDMAAVAVTVARAGRKPRGLAKKELFDAPVVGTFLRSVGAICVDRAGDPAAAFVEAEAALRAGECLVIMPQGTIPRGQAFFEPRLVGKTGAARLAAATGARVVPLGIWGSEAVWPRSARFPDVTNLLHPPTVRCRVGPPVRGLSGTDAGADTAAIMDAIAAQLPPEASLPRIPTADELARAMPPG